MASEGKQIKAAAKKPVKAAKPKKPAARKSVPAKKSTSSRSQLASAPSPTVPTKAPKSVAQPAPVPAAEPTPHPAPSEPVVPPTMPAHNPVPPATASQPRLRDYALAIWQLFWAWLKRFKKPVIITLVILLMFSFFWSFWTGHHKNPQLKNNDLILAVSRQAGIKGETNPAVLTVIDKEKANQPFLDESEDGDKILLFYKSHKAVLYRPAQNKIVKTGSFTPPDAKVQIRQGSTDEKRVAVVTETIKSVSGTELETRDDSVLKNYTQTIVVSVTGRYDAEASALAKALGAPLRTIPQNESIPDADILVIVGTK